MVEESGREERRRSGNECAEESQGQLGQPLLWWSLQLDQEPKSRLT